MRFQRLEDLRVDADKTQQEIADVLHCKREVYRRYEKGIHELPVWALIELAKYYHTTTDYILGLSDKRRKDRRWRSFYALAGEGGQSRSTLRGGTSRTPSPTARSAVIANQ